MTPAGTPLGTLDAHLRRVEQLLEEAEADLRAQGRQAPGAGCARALGAAAAEMRAVSGLVLPPAPELDRAGFGRQLRAVAGRLQRVARLLAAAAEFYRGWCAAAPAPDYPAPGYAAESVAGVRGPALLACQG